jgi:hypothetical protein
MPRLMYNVRMYTASASELSLAVLQSQYKCRSTLCCRDDFFEKNQSWTYPPLAQLIQPRSVRVKWLIPSWQQFHEQHTRINNILQPHHPPSLRQLPGLLLLYLQYHIVSKVLVVDVIGIRVEVSRYLRGCLYPTRLTVVSSRF